MRTSYLMEDTMSALLATQKHVETPRLGEKRSLQKILVFVPTPGSETNCTLGGAWITFVIPKLIKV